MTDLRWLMIPAVLVLLALTAEVLARLWVQHRRRYYVLPPGLRMELHPDPRFFPRLETTVRFEVNRDGERGDEVPRLRNGETLYRILVVGGSQPEGWFLDQDTTWPGALQRLLETPAQAMTLGASRVHVGSIARSGIGSDALSLILDRVLPRYDRLQAIIILVGASDVLRWLEQDAPPSPASPLPVTEVFRSHPEMKFGWRPGRLALFELWQRARRRWLRPVVVHERGGAWVAKARAMRAHAKVTRTSMPDAAPMLDHFERHFGQVLRTAQAHAARVLVVRQPWFDRDCTPEESAQMWHGGVGQAWKDDLTVFYSHDVLSRLMSLLDARAARVSDEMGIEHVDLRLFLEPSVETYYDYFHATPAGARTVAAVVARAITRQPLPAVRPSAELTRASA